LPSRITRRPCHWPDLLEGGLPIAEITFRTHAAAAVIEKIAFGVPPGFNPKIVGESLKINFHFSPGVMTPSDVEGALSFGIKVLKFFPAGAAGGVKMLSSIAAPYTHLGVRFIPTGGVSQDNMKDYLEQKTVLAIGGTWIATREDIAASRWKMIRDNCRAASAIVKQLQAAASAGR
jgi:2-dehydro-3-deoxyphosphogluconate aldolase/(4S)-4-hydroxy-2-oxoglutarate aldolase